MRRATSEEQKAQRRQAILDSAWALFQEQPFDAVSMEDVAAGAGVAKGTVFLYFPTKEELFLALQLHHLEAWFAEVDQRLGELGENSAPPTVAAVVARSLAERPGLTRLFAILHVILEHNVRYETALAFKQTLLAHLEQTGGLLERRLPFLRAGEGAALLLRAYALVIGVQHLAHPAPVVREVLAREAGMSFFELSFSETMEATLTTLIVGAAAQRKGDGQ